MAHRLREVTESYRLGEPLSFKVGRSVVRARDAAGAAVVVKRIAPASNPATAGGSFSGAPATAGGSFSGAPATAGASSGAPATAGGLAAGYLAGGSPAASSWSGAAPFALAMERLAGLRRPAFPVLRDSGLGADGNAFLVFDELSGRPGSALAGGAPAQILSPLLQVLDGLETAAGRGLSLHNLSPDNLLLVLEPAGERAVLLGWGTRFFRPAEPVDGTDFTAPEARTVEGALAADSRSDLWSFARVACHLLGVPVTDGPAPQVALPLGLRFELDDADALQRVLERALRAEPDERPSFAEVRQAFRRALGKATATAPPPVRLQFVNETPDPPPTPTAPEEHAGDSTNPVLAQHLAGWFAAQRTAAAQPAERTGTDEHGPDTDEHGPGSAPLPSPAPVSPLVSTAEPDRALGAESPPPPELPLPAAPAALPAAPAARPAPRRRSLLAAAAAAGVLLAAALLLWLWPRFATTPDTPAPPPVAAPPAAPAAPPAAAPPIEPGLPAPELPPALVAALAAFGAGDDAGARRALAALGPDAERRLPPQACTAYLALGEALAAAGRERLAADLRAALQKGDLARLAAAVQAAAGQEAQLLRAEPALRVPLAQAKRIAELHRALEQAARGGEHARTLELAAALAPLVPGSPVPGERRAAAAAALESEADRLADAGDLGAALARLEELRRQWPDRPGLAERFARLSAESRSDDSVESVLASAAAAEGRKRPDEGLALLRGVVATPRTAPRIQELRQRLERQLELLDHNPPAVEIPAGELSYDKGQPAVVVFRVSDDYQVQSVAVRVRPEGARAATQLTPDRSGASYRLEIPATLHQNRTLELTVTATDLSGHTGESGSRQVRRKRFLDRLRSGKEDGG